MGKIGIGISTTPNRADIFQASLKEWVKYQPKNSTLVVYNDTLYEGVAKSKNILLRELYRNRCNHFFLVDDDCIPLKNEWWEPYVLSNEAHLMYQFKLPGRSASDMREIYRDDKIVSYSHTRGAMLYVNKQVLHTVGGMDTGYGQAYYEHTDWTNRIHNAGLTTHRAMDVVGSDKLIYCLDQDGKAESSIPADIKKRNRRGNFSKYQKSKRVKNIRSSDEYKGRGVRLL